VVGVGQDLGYTGSEGIRGDRSPHPDGREKVDGVGVGGPVDLVRRGEGRELCDC